MNKNKKGQINMTILIVLAVAIIVGLIFFQEVANNVEQGTRTVSGVVNVYNQSITTPAANGILELTGQELVGTPIVTNTSTSTVMTTTNYTVSECVRTSDNLKGICYTALTANGAAKAFNISYSYYPNGYIDNAGSRSIAGIIVLLFAVGLVIVVLAPMIKEKFE
jgi:hypothetical protein